MTDHILTDAEGADFVRTETDNPAMLQLLDLVDAQVFAATGREWALDTIIHPLAKSAAGIILTAWYDDPALVGQTPPRAVGVLTQLEAEALKYRRYVFFGCYGGGRIALPNAIMGDVVQKLIGVYGVSGDQSANFESVVSIDGAFLQTSTQNFTLCKFAVILKNPAEDVT